MDSFSTFIDMGGYAVFVWSSYALALLGLVGVLTFTRRAVRTRQAELDRLRPSSANPTSGGDTLADQANVSLDKGTQTGET